MPKIATQCFVLRMAQTDQRCCPVHTIWDVRPFLDDRKLVAVWPIHLYQIQCSKHERYETPTPRQSRVSAGPFETLHSSQTYFVTGRQQWQD